MSFSNRLIGLFCLFTPCLNAHEVSFDALYWRMTESFDWVLLNDRNVPNQSIAYQTANFHYDPGFRIAFTSQGPWDTQLSYTRYHTKTRDSASGEVTPTLLASKIAQPSIGYFYLSGQMEFTVNYNVLDLDIAKQFAITHNLWLGPIIGLRGSWIDQSIYTSLQGQISVMENLKNNFKGIGPKAGIEASLMAFQNPDWKFHVLANFTTAYLWGNWSIKDELTDSTSRTIMINNKARNISALSFQTLLGFGIDYHNCSLKFGYELSDWLDQFQIFDDGTGGHANDLVLQGLTMGLSYQF